MSYGNGGSFDPGSVPGGQRPYPQSYNDPNFPHRQPTRSSNRTLFWVLGIIAAIVLIGAVACCGFGYYGFQFIGSQLANQLRPQLQNSPEIVEHIGEIQTMTLNPQAMQQTDHSGKMVFDVTGTQGNGQIVVDPEQLGQQTADEGVVLILPDGRQIPLTGFAPPPPPADSEPVDPKAGDDPPPNDSPDDAVSTEAELESPTDAEAESSAESSAETTPAA